MLPRIALQLFDLVLALRRCLLPCTAAATDFASRTQLRQHLIDQHGAPEAVVIDFSSLQDFDAWRVKLEQQSNCRFVNGDSRIVKKLAARVQDLLCSRDGVPRKNTAARQTDQIRPPPLGSFAQIGRALRGHALGHDCGCRIATFCRPKLHAPSWNRARVGFLQPFARAGQAVSAALSNAVWTDRTLLDSLSSLRVDPDTILNLVRGRALHRCLPTRVSVLRAG